MLDITTKKQVALTIDCPICVGSCHGHQFSTADLKAGTRAQYPKISGAQPKTLEIIDGSLWLIKRTPSAFPFSAENEFLTMSLLKTLGFDVPEFGLIKETLGVFKVTSYATRSFLKNGEQLYDGASFLQVPSTEKYDVYIDHFLQNLSELQELSSFAELILVSSFVGNGDLHLKNFGIIEDDTGFRPSPVYDVLCTRVYCDLTNALTFHGKSSKLNLSDWSEIWEMCNCTSSLSDMAQHMKSSIEGYIISLIENPPEVPQDFLYQYLQQLNIAACQTASKLKVASTDLASEIAIALKPTSQKRSRRRCRC